MKKILIKITGALILLILVFGLWYFKPWLKRHNVVFISVDDMNNWVSILKKYPGIKTPNLDRLANMSANFLEAHVASPVCNPSRFATLTGLLPSTTEIYYRKSPSEEYVKEKKFKFIMDYFKKAGYYTVGIGKILHTGENNDYDWDKYYKFKIDKDRERKNGIPEITESFFDWGEFTGNEEDICDLKMVNDAKSFLDKLHFRPFFLAVGLHSPHLPWIVPSRFFDLYPPESVQLLSKADDIDDLPEAARKFIQTEDEELIKTEENKKAAVRAYLAALSFTDELLGKLLDAIEDSKYADNTIIVFWSDHGHHLGHKNHWRKSTLWRESTHIPFLISTPEVREHGALQVKDPVSLVDVAPTLFDLCGIKYSPSDFDGYSLSPLLNKGSNLAWNHPAITIMGPGNYSVHLGHWHYILYANGDQELYDLRNDKDDLYNLAQDGSYKEVLESLRQSLEITKIQK